MFLQKSVGNPLLFQSHFFSKPIIKEIVEERLLIPAQVAKRSTIWGVLAHPERAMGRQCFTVHQKGARAWKHRPQTIKHGKTMGVDIAPIVDLPATDP